MTSDRQTPSWQGRRRPRDWWVNQLKGCLPLVFPLRARPPCFRSRPRIPTKRKLYQGRWDIARVVLEANDSRTVFETLLISHRVA